MNGQHEILQRISHRLPLEERSWEHVGARYEHPHAAVLVALTAESEPRVLLGRRAAHLKLHPGEIAFAGGKREVEDRSPWDTAAREAMEEVGIGLEHITRMGELEPLITRTGFQVFPCVAQVPPAPELVVDPGEFDSAFFAHLSRFADPELFQLKTLFDGVVHRRVPHYQLADDSVWGVTAAILAQLANVAYDAGLDLQRNWKEKP